MSEGLIRDGVDVPDASQDQYTTSSQFYHEAQYRLGPLATEADIIVYAELLSMYEETKRAIRLAEAEVSYYERAFAELDFRNPNQAALIPSLALGHEEAEKRVWERKAELVHLMPPITELINRSYPPTGIYK